MSDGKFSIPRDSIPVSWTVCRVQDAGTVQLGRQRSPKDHSGRHMRPYLRAANVFEDRIDTSDVKEMNFTPEEFENFRLHEGDILLNEGQSLELVGRPAMFCGEVADCCFQNTLVRFVPAQILDGKFALKLFQHYMRNGRFQKIARWTTNIAHLGASRFADLEIPLPPLAEQKRIVAKIEELFSELEAGEESLRVARRQLGVYRQSLLKQAFEGKLTEKWRTQNPAKLESPDQLLARIQSARQTRYEQQIKEWESSLSAWEMGDQSASKPRRPSAPDDVETLPSEILNEMAALPSSWFWGRLGSMTLGVEYGTAAKSSETGACPVIRMGNLQGGEIDWNDLVFTSDETEIAQYRLSPGDVLFNRTNSPELVGKTAIYRGNRPAVFAGYLIRVNQIESVVCSGYLNYFLNSGVARGYGNSVKTDGVNQSNINGAKLSGYPFPYCSLPEQQEIVRLLDAQFEVIEQNEREIDAALQRSEALRQTILKKAFTGRLVAQDHADEPASTLLARFRAKSEVPARNAENRTTAKFSKVSA